MKSRDIFREWMRGCGCADKNKPWTCGECTLAMLGAVNKAMDSEELEEQVAKTEGVVAQLGGAGLLDSLRKRFGEKIDQAVRRELGDVVEARDNAETANHGLRVELHITQQHLAAAQAAVNQLARGAGLTKSAHLREVAELRAELAKVQARVADLERTRR